MEAEMVGSPVRVLLVEDDEDDCVLVRRMLEQSEGATYALEWAANYDAGLTAIRRQKHDVGLLDYRLGGRTGLDLLNEAVAAGCKSPLILLTGRGDREVDLAAMRAGAADFLPKDRLSADLLERSIRYSIERRRSDEQLRQAQKMEAIGRLAGGVAHDFNNLMTVVIGFSEALQACLPPGDPAREQIDKIHKAGARCASLTQQLLAFGRKQLFSLRHLDLNSVVNGVVSLVRPLLGTNIELTVTLGPNLGRVRADPVQLEQVVMNLCVNARDAMPRGGRLALTTSNVELTEDDVRRRSELRPGRYVVLTASDTGCGMDPDTLTHIFEPFFTTKGPGQGTGLGLATVYGIVKQSDGYIFAESQLNSGTTFRVYLPRHEVLTPIEAAAAPAHPTTTTDGRETILVVEDEDAVRALFQQVLRGAGYDVLSARDGLEALSLCSRHPETIDLVLTDLVMPFMSGAELATRLSKLRPGMRTLYVSGFTEDALAIHGVQEKHAAFLQKPFSLVDLTRKVRDVLDQGLPVNSASPEKNGATRQP